MKFYAVLIIPSLPFFPEIKSEFDLGEGFLIRNGKVEENFKEKINFEWLSSIRLDTDYFGSEHLYLITSGLESTDKLEAKLFIIYNLMLVTSSFLPPNTKPIIISGTIDSNGILENPNSLIAVNTWQKSYYAENFSDECDDYLHGCVSSENLTKLANLTKCFLQNHEKEYFKYIVEAYRSYVEAFFTKSLEFKIPNLVRAVESFVAIPPGKGKKEFSKRVNSFISIIAQPFVQGTDILKELESLYELRNNCTHGKTIRDFFEKREFKESVEKEMAKYELLSEEISRQFLSSAIAGNPFTEICGSREGLEAYWNDLKRKN